MHVKSISFWLQQPLNQILNDTTGHCLTFAIHLWESVTFSVTNRQPVLIKGEWGSYKALQDKWHLHEMEMKPTCDFAFVCAVCQMLLLVCLPYNYICFTFTGDPRTKGSPLGPSLHPAILSNQFSKTLKRHHLCVVNRNARQISMYSVTFPIVCLFFLDSTVSEGV